MLLYLITNARSLVSRRNFYMIYVVCWPQWHFSVSLSQYKSQRKCRNIFRLSLSVKSAIIVENVLLDCNGLKNLASSGHNHFCDTWISNGNERCKWCCSPQNFLISYSMCAENFHKNLSKNIVIRLCMISVKLSLINWCLESAGTSFNVNMQLGNQ